MQYTLRFTCTFTPDIFVGQGSFGLLTKTSQFIQPDLGGSDTFSAVVNHTVTGDLSGTTIAGQPGERFIYFGLHNGTRWLRRWKLREAQLRQIFETSDTDQTYFVVLLLGHKVTPEIGDVTSRLEAGQEIVS